MVYSNLSISILQMRARIIPVIFDFKDICKLQIDVIIDLMDKQQFNHYNEETSRSYTVIEKRRNNSYA